MKLPDKVKIGGKIYSVEETDKLELGCDYNGEILYQNLIINIRPALAQQVKEVTFVHELLHGIYNHLGYHKQDEKKIDELANALHAVIIDNPGLFSDTK